ncbi:UNVERIFIED_CONTAM: hypothetical protein HHA_451850 [Hammondia hammondi]|eukprot:XP_008884827.1 hypothetical protein HHA_451850 [Hammondia hammondi]
MSNCLLNGLRAQMSSKQPVHTRETEKRQRRWPPPEETMALCDKWRKHLTTFSPPKKLKRNKLSDQRRLLCLAPRHKGGRNEALN